MNIEVKTEDRGQKAEGLKADDKLPQGWAIAKLGDIVNVKNGYAFKSKDYCDQGIKLVRISDIQDGEVSLANAVSIPLDKIKNDFLIEQGDLLIAMSGATTGKVGIYNDSKPCLQNQRVGNFKIKSHLIIDSEFRNFLIHSLRKEIELSAYGGAQPNISASKLESFEIPLPPLNEQKRIVAKLEKLLAKVNESCDRLSRIPTILKRFRQSVLASACSGCLTADWRKSHPNIEPAEELLKKDIGNDINELPQSWCFVSVGDVIKELKYGTSKKCSYDKQSHPVLRIPNVVQGVIDCSDLKYTELSDKEYETLRLKIGDILMIRSNGSVSLIGKTAMVTQSEEGFAYAGYLIRLRPNLSVIDPSYLNYYLSSYEIRLQIELPARSTSGVNNINSTEVKKLAIAVPPLEEQKEIVRRVEVLFRKCDLIEQRYLKAKTYTDKLTQSILAKAFRGELVPQDSNDEPAEVLLERIREEKTLTEKSSKGKKRCDRKKS